MRPSRSPSIPACSEMTPHFPLPEFANLVPNPDWASLPLFDRSGWKRVRFGDFAQSVNERVEPADAAEEIYVGLDDLDLRSLHIRRWGKGSDVTGTKLRFQKGDIIFGRRRAYQRKVGVAEFDGICSAHASHQKGPFIRVLCARYPRLHLERLPAYAPDLNPVEQVWSHLKYARLPNFVPGSLSHLDRTVRSHRQSVGQTPGLLKALWHGSTRPFPLPSLLN